MSLQNIMSQEDSAYTGKRRPFFVDIEAGYLPLFGHQLLLNGGIGYRFNERFELSTNFVHMSWVTDYGNAGFANNIGLQARWTPRGMFHYKLHGGYVLDADRSYDSDNTISMYDRAASQKFYYGISAGIKLFDFLSLNINLILTGTQFLEVRRYYPTNELLSPFPFHIAVFCLSFETVLPTTYWEK
jgi:hypothetical protein